MINEVVIYGERCSGTNYLEELININFDARITWDYGWKHFFGFNHYQGSDNTLFICIVRGLEPWLNSFFRKPHHLPLRYKKGLSHDQKVDEFLNKEFWSIDDNNDKKGQGCLEIINDRNIYTKLRYKNIFEMRHVKIKYLKEDLPLKVKNHIFIKYEDLINNFNDVMFKILRRGLKVLHTNRNTFPKNTVNYKNTKSDKYVPNTTVFIKHELIFNNPRFNKHYEKILGYYP